PNNDSPASDSRGIREDSPTLVTDKSRKKSMNREKSLSAAELSASSTANHRTTRKDGLHPDHVSTDTMGLTDEDQI
ncbi:hypothetical protein BGX26_009113, partial [Mortierella sp. AD094]